MNKTPTRKENTDLLQRGIMCALIGVAVLVGPYFMAPTGMRDAIAGSSLVGWFALVLGLAFLGLYARRKPWKKPGTR
jgi:VIT1/CCC1 family predicted Fe2+/Mn2+ transporter